VLHHYVNIKEEELKYNEHTVTYHENSTTYHETQIFPGKKTGGNISSTSKRSFCQEMIDDGANLG
jgi:hypothetical protein